MGSEIAFEAFDPKRWVLVGDYTSCPHTRAQVSFIKQNKLPLYGAIMCDEADTKTSEVCSDLEYFPAFCNLDSNFCLTGGRKTVEEFDELQRRSDERRAATTGAKSTAKATAEAKA